ncbi:MAG: AmmeMemoRadiSam system radical SAM enzyme [Draconibacterium sp.]|nr:MAG: AmmeMemoRadiSam system radical SAM enzyme [Draconibacterium sp.]
MMKEAQFYTTMQNNQVQCTLCPWKCMLKPGQTGVCKVRENRNGQLVTFIYECVAALGIDPIEKKPLYHFYPGKNILSVGEVGCNLHCSFCQNHRISQCFANKFTGFHNISCETIVDEAQKTWNNIGVAYTYNEPFTFYEFMLETATLVKEKGLKNVVVSNGYVNKEPLEDILQVIDAFNIDLKAFSKKFYQTHTKGKLNYVLKTLETIAKSDAHLEITYLVIPGLNDNEAEFEAMAEWIAANLGKFVPLHLSRYFPNYKMEIPPTPLSTLNLLYDIASQYLDYVYMGNVSDEKRSTTYCSHCGNILISRNSYTILTSGINNNGSCAVCHFPSAIVI